jgi:deoxycytidine triphosphate deaminase
MPHIPIPPKTAAPMPGVQTITSGTTNWNAPVSYNKSEIEKIAEQQARMVLDEWMKQNKDLFESKESKLKISNIAKIIGMKYDDRLTIIGVLEEATYYEFHLNNDRMNSPYSIILHRRQTDSGHYIMEYEGKTLWVTKEEIDMPEKIIICMNTI